MLTDVGSNVEYIPFPPWIFTSHFWNALFKESSNILRSQKCPLSGFGMAHTNKRVIAISWAPGMRADLFFELVYVWTGLSNSGFVFFPIPGTRKRDFFSSDIVWNWSSFLTIAAHELACKKLSSRSVCKGETISSWEDRSIAFSRKMSQTLPKVPSLVSFVLAKKHK